MMQVFFKAKTPFLAIESHLLFLGTGGLAYLFAYVWSLSS
jgi:hypothetical protein